MYLWVVEELIWDLGYVSVGSRGLTVGSGVCVGSGRLTVGSGVSVGRALLDWACWVAGAHSPVLLLTASGGVPTAKLQVEKQNIRLVTGPTLDLHGNYC